MLRSSKTLFQEETSLALQVQLKSTMNESYRRRLKRKLAICIQYIKAMKGKGYVRKQLLMISWLWHQIFSFFSYYILHNETHILRIILPFYMKTTLKSIQYIRLNIISFLRKTNKYFRCVHTSLGMSVAAKPFKISYH